MKRSPTHHYATTHPKPLVDKNDMIADAHLQLVVDFIDDASHHIQHRMYHRPIVNVVRHACTILGEVEAAQVVTLIAAGVAAVAALFAALTNIVGTRETARRSWAREIRFPVYAQFASAAAAVVRTAEMMTTSVPEGVQGRASAEGGEQLLARFMREHAAERLLEVLKSLDNATGALELLASDDVRTYATQFSTRTFEWAILTSPGADAALTATPTSIEAILESYRPLVIALRRDIGTEQ